MSYYEYYLYWKNQLYEAERDYWKGTTKRRQQTAIEEMVRCRNKIALVSHSTQKFLPV